MSTPSPETIEALLREAVASATFSAAQLCVVSPSFTLSTAVGTTAYPDYQPSVPIDEDSRFDVASLTKALATSVLLMQAVEADRLSLDAPLSTLTTLRGLHFADQITVRMLASHRGGLLAHRPFFESMGEVWGRREEAQAQFLALLGAYDLDAAPGTRTIYSDPSYILLGWALEEALGAGLDVLFEQQVSAPLALKGTSFGPVTGDVVATELDETGEPLRGVVHDDNCRALGGVAGHAGLFSNALEVVQIVRHLAAAARGEDGVVGRDTVTAFWCPIPESSFTLGWDTPTPPGSTAGQYMRPGATVGHLGFTGCSVWHDHARDVTIALLTNRVHPTRENQKIRSFRPQLHDLVNRVVGVH